ncbi:MBL fold metallo-hydrolase [Uniformispora flossi]|uniref:MBL fold metallo-hydrolase n=1 Tax=Uniformispora flossi TaxID=3390723 RepID=UPI003C2BF15B
MSLPTTRDPRTADRAAPGPGKLTEVADRVLAYIQPDGGWCVSNSGALIGPDAVAVIDTAATRARALALADALAAVTPLRPRTLVNTHAHGDHTFGNFAFAPEATVIGHDLARAEIVANGHMLRDLWPDTEWGEFPIVPPSVTFPTRLTLHVGDILVELIHVGPAHTTGDVVAWLPEERVLFAGDVLLSGCTPFVLMGSVAGSLRAVARLRALGPRTVVCGHGPVCGPEVLDTTELYLNWLHATARAGIDAGLTPLQTALDTTLGDFAGLLDPERLVGNLHRAYAEERGAPEGAAVPLGPALEDMVAWNGGRPLTCLA